MFEKEKDILKIFDKPFARPLSQLEESNIDLFEKDFVIRANTILLYHKISEEDIMSMTLEQRITYIYLLIKE